MDPSCVNRFSEALDQKQYLDFNFKLGRWFESSITNRINEYVHGTCARLIHMAQQWTSYLDYIERFPVSWNENGIVNQTFYISCIEAGKKSLDQFIGKKIDPSSYWQLKWRVVALEYRIQEKRERAEESKQDHDLLELVAKWKESQWQRRAQDRKITEKDHQKISSLQNEFSELIEIVKNDPSIRSEVFKWLFRYGNEVEPLALFPRTQQRLKGANLASRISYLCKSRLNIRIRGKKTRKRVITLPFTLYGKKKASHISLLNEQKKVTLESNWTLTVGKVLDICRHKSIEPGNIEFFAHDGGFRNWASYEWGVWDPKAKVHSRIDFDSNTWWEELRLEAKLSKRQVKFYFSKYCSKDEQKAFEDSVDQKAPFIAPRATRSSSDFDMNGCHAFFLIGLWDKELKKYKIYNFGLYPEGFPTTTFGYLWFFAAAHRAKMQFPDDNIHYLHREHKLDLQSITSNDVQKLMEIVARSIKKTLDYKTVFIWPSHSCATEVVEMMSKLNANIDRELRIPHFEKPILSASPKNLWALLIKLYSPLPVKWQNRMLALLFLFLGGFRGVVADGKKRSYYQSDYWPTNSNAKRNVRQATVKIPSYFFDLEEEKKKET